DRLFDGPRNAELGVVPQDPSFGCWNVEVRALVHEEGRFAGHAEAVRESGRNEHLTLVFAGQRDRDPMAEMRGSPTDVDGHVVDFSLQHRDELSLASRMLEVQP